MIDLHLHLLPGVDDGPATREESVRLIEALAAHGYRQVVATPHLMEPLSDAYRAEVERAHEGILPAAAAAGIEVLLGFEHMTRPDLVSRLASGEPSTLGESSAVLVEFPFTGWNYELDRYLFDLQEAGYQPILAHPERYVAAQDQPDLVLAMADRGVVLQVTAGSLVGAYGRPAQKLARQVVRLATEGTTLVVLATDAHSAGSRFTAAIAGMRWVARQHPQGAAWLSWATEVVPGALLASEPVPAFAGWVAATPEALVRPRRMRALAWKIASLRNRDHFRTGS
jgi:protein-tyrosine phosphatase